MEENFQFDREKFKEVVHFIVHHAMESYGADALGNTKLHKALYYSDILRYLDTGRPMTGDDYKRQRFGPTAKHLSWAINTLTGEGRITVSTRNYYGYPKSEYVALVRPDLARLASQEIDLVKEMVGFVCAHTAVEVSDFSHVDVWASVPMGERIPYYAAFALFPAEATEQDVEDAVQEAVRLAPVIEAQERDGAVL